MGFSRKSSAPDSIPFTRCAARSRCNDVVELTICRIDRVANDAGLGARLGPDAKDRNNQLGVPIIRNAVLALEREEVFLDVEIQIDACHVELEHAARRALELTVSPSTQPPGG